MASQRQSNKKDFHKTYIIAHRNGEILTAHCTCMAGSGKACSHAAAVAYKVDALRRLILEESACTSVLCSWNDMSKKKATPAMLEDMDFQRPKYGKTFMTLSSPKNQHPQKIQGGSHLTNNEISQLRKIASNAAVFSSIDLKKQVQLPLTPIEVFHGLKGFDGIDYIDALRSTLNEDSIRHLAKVTVRQAKSKLWKKHRKGRITGSKMHSFFQN